MHVERSQHIDQGETLPRDWGTQQPSVARSGLLLACNSDRATALADPARVWWHSGGLLRVLVFRWDVWWTTYLGSDRVRQGLSSLLIGSRGTLGLVPVLGGRGEVVTLLTCALGEA